MLPKVVPRQVEAKPTTGRGDYYASSAGIDSHTLSYHVPELSGG